MFLEAGPGYPEDWAPLGLGPCESPLTGRTPSQTPSPCGMGLRLQQGLCPQGLNDVEAGGPSTSGSGPSLSGSGPSGTGFLWRDEKDVALTLVSPHPPKTMAARGHLGAEVSLQSWWPEYASCAASREPWARGRRTEVGAAGGSRAQDGARAVSVIHGLGRVRPLQASAAAFAAPGLVARTQETHSAVRFSW